MSNPIRLTRKDVREEFKQFLIFKWYCPEFISKEFLNRLMDQLTFENDVIEFLSVTDLTFQFNILIDEAIQWQQKEWEKQYGPPSTKRVFEPIREGDELPF